MISYNCKNESDLFVGFNSAEADSTYESLEHFKCSAQMVKKLWEDMRKIFFSQLRDEQNTDTIKQKASAWYVACYSSAENKKRLKVLSFPWIIEDVLGSMFSIRNYDYFSKSVVESYCSNRDDYNCMSRFIQKIELKNEISKLVNTPLVLSGAFGLFLFDESNEVHLISVNSSISIKNMKEMLDDHFDKVSVSSDELTLVCQQDENTMFTISESRVSLLRFLYMRRLIFENPLLLTFLYALVHFARMDGLFSVLNTENVKLEVLVEHCSAFYLKENNIDDLSQSELDQCYAELSSCPKSHDCVDEWSKLQDFLDDFCRNEENFLRIGLGKTLLKFYKENGLG